MVAGDRLFLVIAKCIMGETSIKVSVINYLYSNGFLNMDASLVDEFVLPGWARRTDLFLVGKDITIFEIKSKNDSLIRLKDQIREYARYCERLIVVCDSIHYSKIAASTSSNVGIWEYREGSGDVNIRRKGRRARLRKKELLRLLRADELRSLVRAELGEVGNLGRTRLVKSAETVGCETLLRFVKDSLRTRFVHQFAALQEKLSKCGRLTLEDAKLLRRNDYVEMRRSDAVDCTVAQKQNAQDFHLCRLADITGCVTPFGIAPFDIRAQFLPNI